jgi:sec-independent protein translocase protein TatB
VIDLGISKMALIGAVALIVIGPEKLPRVARMVGTMIGRAQRYVSDVKAEVNRSMDLEELKKMKDTVENAARDVESSISSTASSINNDFEKSWQDATDQASPSFESFPTYENPKKKWRMKTSATPKWYKGRAGVRTHAQSGAARVARYRAVKP